jgi:nucleoside-diphosphate-sugar epimerase
MMRVAEMKKIGVNEEYALAAGFSLFRQDLDHAVREADSVWPSLSDASIFITGGTGFFGMWLVETLLWANTLHKLNLHLTVLSRNSKLFLAGRGSHLQNNSRVTVLQGSITEFTVAESRFTHIIHAASESKTDVSMNWATSHLTSALDGTRRIIDLAAKHATKVVLFTSSGAVYQQTEGLFANRFTEGIGRLEDYTNARRVYAEAKRAMELMLAAGSERHGYRLAIARCFAFSGPYMPLTGGLAMGNFIRDVLQGREISVAGDGTALRSYLYGADLAVWLLTILAKGENCRPYNVGGSESISIAALAREVSAVAGGTGPVVIRKTSPADTPPEIYVPNLKRSFTELGVRVMIDIPESIRRSLAWFSNYTIP